MTRSDVFGHVGGCFTNYRKLVDDSASHQFRLLECVAVKPTYELRDEIDGLEDIPQVQFLTPYRGAATPV